MHIHLVKSGTVAYGWYSCTPCRMRETSLKLDLTLQFPIDLMGWHNYYPGGVSGRSNLITIAAIHTQICPSLDFLQPKEIADFLPMLKCFTRAVDVVWCLLVLTLFGSNLLWTSTWFIRWQRLFVSVLWCIVGQHVIREHTNAWLLMGQTGMPKTWRNEFLNPKSIRFHRPEASGLFG